VETGCLPPTLPLRRRPRVRLPTEELVHHARRFALNRRDDMAVAVKGEATLLCPSISETIFT
jgi:hypothetical protein